LPTPNSPIDNRDPLLYNVCMMKNNDLMRDVLKNLLEYQEEYLAEEEAGLIELRETDPTDTSLVSTCSGHYANAAAKLESFIPYVASLASHVESIKTMIAAEEIDAEEYVNIFRNSSWDLASFLGAHLDDDPWSMYDVTEEERVAMIAIHPDYATVDFTGFDT